MPQVKKIIKCIKGDSLRDFFCRVGRFLIIRYIRIKNFLIRNFIKITSRKRYIIKEILGSKMYLDLTDTGICQELLFNDIREPLAIELVQKIIKPGDIIIDIGANIGYYALLEAKLTGGAGKVFALEPAVENIKILKKNISLNNYYNIEVFQLAVGGKNGVLPFYLSKKSNWHSFFKSDTLAPTIIGKIPTKVVTLDAFVEDKPFPTFIRMDVEGYELEIIKGMKKLLKLNRPLKILIEVHFHILKNKTRNLLITLKKFGFRASAVTCEANLLLVNEPPLIRNLFHFFSQRLDLDLYQAGHLNMDIDDLLSDKLLMGGKKGGVHILFERE